MYIFTINTKKNTKFIIKRDEFVATGVTKKNKSFVSKCLRIYFVMEKKVDLQTFKESVNYSKWKGKFLPEKLDSILDELNFKKSEVDRMELRIDLEEDGFFKSSNIGKMQSTNVKTNFN